MSDWSILLGLIFTSSVTTAVLSKLIDRSATHADRLREGYAEAAKALAAWNQFPYRIERRINDEPDTRKALSEMGSDITERLAYYSGWIGAESSVMGEFYMLLVERLRVDVAKHARRAWEQPARTSSAEMNIRKDTSTLSEGTSGWVHVQAFSRGFRYRFGWRRYFIPPSLLQRQLIRKGLWPSRSHQRDPNE